MCNKRGHNIINIIFLMLLNIFTFLIMPNICTIGIVIFFCSGYLLSTFLFSPDLDIHIPKQLGILRILFVPYRDIFNHRGISHMPIIGTLTRVAYILLILSILSVPIIILLYTYNLITTISIGSLVVWLKGRWVYFAAALVGSTIADTAHVISDVISTAIKKTF